MKAFLTGAVQRFSSQCDYLEVRIEETSTSSIAFKGPNLDILRESEGRGGCVRALTNGGWGFVTFNKLDALEDHIAAAVRQAKMVGRQESNLAEAPVVVDKVTPEMKLDPRYIPLGKKMELLQNYNELMMDYHEAVKSTVVSYGDSSRKIWLANSQGTYIEQEKRDMGANFIPVCIKNGETQMAVVGCGSSTDFNVISGLEEELKNACSIAVDLLDAPSIQGGAYSVVADPHMAGVFIHEAFGHMSEAEKVYENKKLQEIMKMGAQIGSPLLTVYDTGLVEGSRGAIHYDEEGVRAQKTYILKNGILEGRLHTRETAGKLNEKPTGNARAVGYSFPPISRMRVTCIDQGDTPFEDMIKDIKSGVYACDAFGGQGGEMFTFTAGRGYMIRNGKIEEMVKNVTLSGNLFTTLKNIDRIGNDFTLHESGGGCGKGAQFPLPVADGSPHIRIQNVVIGGQ